MADPVRDAEERQQTVSALSNVVAGLASMGLPAPPVWMLPPLAWLAPLGWLASFPPQPPGTQAAHHLKLVGAEEAEDAEVGALISSFDGRLTEAEERIDRVLARLGRE